MGSSRTTRSATNENIDTYDSGGGQDYDALTDWEVATDVDHRAGSGTGDSPVLEVYAGYHNDGSQQAWQQRVKVCIERANERGVDLLSGMGL